MWTLDGWRSSPTGVPDLPLVDPLTVKPGLGVEGREVILSFGLLGPGKGYELALDALPAVVAVHPNALYVVVGATHPDLLRTQGETYRQGLVQQVQRLGLKNHVMFVDRFVGRVELTRWLEAADVFVTPYPNLDQIVSGTLSYAMGAGRAIVSTPYAYATELLADGRGILVHAWIAVGARGRAPHVLGDHDLRAAIGRRAHEYSRQMVWSAVGAQYNRLFARVTASAPSVIRTAAPGRRSMPDRSPLHPVSRQHLGALTDAVGIMQHAIGSSTGPGPRLLHRRRRPGPPGRPAPRERARLARGRRACQAQPGVPGRSLRS